MQDEEWMQGEEVIEEFDLNVGGLVGAVASIEGTGQLVTGTRNDESGIGLNGKRNNNNNSNAPAAVAPGNRLAVHSIRDTQGRVLGLGPRRGLVSSDGIDGQDAAAGWEPVVEASAAHEGAVTGIGVVGGFGNPGGVTSVTTSGGDGRLRLFQLALGGDPIGDGASYPPDPDDLVLSLQGRVAAHEGRATGVAASRRRAVTVGEDGVACLVDLQRIDGGREEGIGGGPDAGGCITWKGQAKGAMPLSGVTFQGESEEVFATVGCDPRAQLMVWDARAKGSSGPVHSFGCVRGSDAAYLCVASQPFNPEVFACGVSTGELLLWDMKSGQVVHELQLENRRGTGAGSWGVAFHPRLPRNLFSCTGSGVLTKWFLPPPGEGAPPPPPVPTAPSFGDGGGGGGGGAVEDGGEWVWRGARDLYALPSRSALVGVCYDEGADTISAVSKHGHVVVAHGVHGLRL